MGFGFLTGVLLWKIKKRRFDFSILLFWATMNHAWEDKENILTFFSA
jgi:hypothetical protein